jgi:hypothetical protein
VSCFGLRFAKTFGQEKSLRGSDLLWKEAHHDAQTDRKQLELITVTLTKRMWGRV